MKFDNYTISERKHTTNYLFAASTV